MKCVLRYTVVKDRKGMEGSLLKVNVFQGRGEGEGKGVRSRHPDTLN